MSEKLLSWLIGSFIFITIAVTCAAIFIPATSEASTVIGLIIGGYVSIVTGTAVGAYATKKVRGQSDHEHDGEDK